MGTIKSATRNEVAEHTFQSEIYAQAIEDVTFGSFFGMPKKIGIKLYSTGKAADSMVIDYLMPNLGKLNYMYNPLISKQILEPREEGYKPMQESLSTFKPEITGLGLGGVLSLGISLYAIATHNIGLATVMAGPFLASILGFTLLLIGFKRKNQ